MKVGRGHLGLHQAPAEQAPAPLQVLHAGAQLVMRPTAQERVGRYRLGNSCKSSEAMGLLLSDVETKSALSGKLQCCNPRGLLWEFGILLY